MKWILVVIGMLGALPVLAKDLPTPPIPPSLAPGSTAAPIPDSGVDAPPIAADAGPTIALKFYRAQTYDPSMGFAPGSRYSTTEDRRPIQTPGFSVSVPLK